MIKQFYNNPRELVKQVDEFSDYKLSVRDDLHRLFSVSLNEKNEKLFEDTIFTAKYVQGLMRVLQKGSSNPDVESLENVKTDLTENMKKTVEQLRELTSDGPETDKTYFEENFLQMSPDAFQNLNKLLQDLEWTKKFLNDLKRNRP
jgi:glutamyl-tRNA reductase